MFYHFLDAAVDAAEELRDVAQVPSLFRFDRVFFLLLSDDR
jgi:hypothetical protein